MSEHYFRRYCLKCDAVHWVEILPIMKETQICHGKNFMPRETATHYTRWRNGGIELCEKISAQPAALPLDWQFMEELANQEW